MKKLILTVEDWVAGVRFGVMAILCRILMQFFGLSTTPASFSEMVVYFTFMTVGWAFISRYVYPRIQRTDSQ